MQKSFFGCQDLGIMSADKYTPQEVSITLEHNSSSPATVSSPTPEAGLWRCVDTTPSTEINLVPAGIDTPKIGIAPVLSGIDTLYIGYNVTVKEEILSFLKEKKAEAKEFEEVQVNLCEKVFTMRPFGYPRYAYVLKSEDLDIWISSKNGMPFPNVYVYCWSIFLASKGCDNVVDFVRTLISSNLGLIISEKVSRVDLYADFTGISLTLEDSKKFVTSAVTRTIHLVKNEQISGLSFGNGSIVARVYDKTKEIKKNKKEYMYELWDGVEEGETVWRVEFELKRDFLLECSIESFEDFKEKSGSIWNYLTEDWLSHRELDNENTTRRSTTEFWSKVQLVSCFKGKFSGMVRETRRHSSISHLLKMIKGCITSIGAIFSLEKPLVTLSWVLSWVIRRVKEELAGTEDSVFVEVKSDLEFAREIKRKAVNYA